MKQPRIIHTTFYNIKTPEGIAIQLPVAGLWSRSAAWLIDLGIRFLIYMSIGFVFAFFGLFGKGLMLISFFVLEWFYPVFYEVLNNGVTPGKKIIGLRVISIRGVHIDWSTSMTRNLMRFIDMLPIIYGVGFISVLLSRYSQRIGDLVAGTVVIYHDNAEFDTESLSAYEASYIDTQTSAFIQQLNRQEKEAFKAYADRHNELSEDRKQELLSFLIPVLKKHNLEETRKTLEQIAYAVTDSYETI